MNKKLLLAISLCTASFSASSSALFDVPLAKKCYITYQKLLTIAEAQTSDDCISELNTAKHQAKNAALEIAEDATYSHYAVTSAINALRHAQVYGCIDEDKIAAAEQDLANILSLLK